ncbi:penicillin-binding transpeptidase domain-containing protein [Thermotoga sp. KOL6]|uniref:penicillin-binding transpeptidase domain-containing protein n=1 Tax=Thermotoga sp. KOL6 TaxID=126741 RepID=UPI000C787C0C|nr:penicillin-binding transpeptidase domain-containing protein [Thermotoga sp. KOL6]PLV58351.1 penicillin-binding protein [Thermotoga sp. KOL6]
MEKRLGFLLLVFALFLIISFVNFFFFPLGRGNPHWYIFIPPKRGSILDAKRRRIAYDSPKYVAYLDVDFFKRQKGEKAALERTLEACGIEEDVDDVLKHNFFKLAEAENKEDVLKKIEPDIIPFVSLELEYRRKKIQDYGMGVLIGTVLNEKGKGGIEGFFENVLKGKKGGFMEFLYKGPRLSPVLTGYSLPENGKDVQTSIDLDLQRRVYEIVEKAVKEFSAAAGHAIVMESKTGKIISMVTTRNWNDLIGGYIEPGSTIKPVVYAIALETAAASVSMTIECNGWIKPVESLSIVIRDIEKHGKISFPTGIVKSCNVMSVKVGELIVKKIGVDGFYKWLKKVGFGSKTGVEMEGEIEGVLREPSKWSLIDPAEISIGQGIGVTPLQLISALNIFANNGYWIKPSISKDSPVEKRKIFSEDVVKVIKQAMVDVVKNGTGKLAQMIGLEIAGKTGTAQKAVSGEYKDLYHSIFVGFFPADDPKYTILVHLDSPSGMFYGGDVAAPVFRRIAELLVEGKEEKIKVIDGLMPDLIGLPIRDALLVLDSLRAKNVKINGKGWVVTNQSPPPNHPLEEEVVLTLGNQK